MKFWLKITMPVIVIGIIGIGVGFVVNQYEDENNCTFSISVEHPFGACHPNRKYRDLCTPGEGCFFKPLILLYPLKKTDVTVRLTYVPGFFATFPEYSEQEKGWRVTAYPDGTLLDKKSGQETYGLFWKGNPGSDHFDISHGSVIKGSEIRDFLYTKLTEIGLNTKEKSDFIMFWYPKLQNYPYVQVTFVRNEYSETAKLDISPKPDSLLRVFMVAKPLSEYKKIPEQTFETFQRKGFSVVEWGGTIIE